MPRSRSGDLAGLAIGAGALVWTGRSARRGVTGREARAFASVNAFPDGAYPSIWLPMQYGSLWVVPTLAGLALLRRRPAVGVALGVSGSAAWFAAKTVKPVVGRGRPAGLVAEVRLRGKDEGDLGFPSGHAAVSAALTVAAWPDAPPRVRLLAAALCGFVPLTRMYVGAHLPLDVIGGSALGLAAGSAVNLMRGGRKRRHDQDDNGERD